MDTLVRLQQSTDDYSIQRSIYCNCLSTVSSERKGQQFHAVTCSNGSRHDIKKRTLPVFQKSSFPDLLNFGQVAYIISLRSVSLYGGGGGFCREGMLTMNE